MADEIRQIEPEDIARVAILLNEGFPRPNQSYWSSVLQQLGARDRPPGTEQYGYGLTVDGVVRGIILTIPSTHRHSGESWTMINLSSWYVQPDYRGDSLALYLTACRRNDVTYTNLTAPRRPITAIVRFGFEQWTSGQIAGFALDSTSRPDARHTMLKLAEAQSEGLGEEDARMLSDHREMGCLVTCLLTADGPEPLVFLKRRIKGVLPCAQLVLCRDESLLHDYGRTIMAWLWRRGHTFLLADCSGPVRGVRGHYFPGRRVRYLRGAKPGVFTDHTYSELILLPGVT